jgi:hypothetical protein
VCKLLLAHGRQLHKAAPTIAEPAQSILHADVVDNGDCFKEQLKDEHSNPETDEEQEKACGSDSARSKEVLPAGARTSAANIPFAESPNP